MKISRDSVAREREESAKETGALLKSQCTKSHWQPLIKGSYRGKGEQTWVLWGETGVCGPGERPEGIITRIPELSPSLTPQHHLLQWTIPILRVSAWGIAIAPASGLPVILLWGAHTMLRGHLPVLGSRGPGRLRRCQWLSCVASELVAIPPNFLWTWLASLIGGSVAPVTPPCIGGSGRTQDRMRFVDLRQGPVLYLPPSLTSE